MPAGSTSPQRTVTDVAWAITRPAPSARPAVGLPVEALPERVDAADDAVELVAPVGVGGPQVVDRVELGEVAESVLGRLGHGHLAGHELSVSFSGRDPEPLGRLLGVEARRLARRHRAQEEPRAEPDRARARGDEVREIPKRPEV